MNINKYDIALGGIGLLIALMAVAYLLFGAVGVLSISILAIGLTGHALFRMGVGVPIRE